MLLLSHFRNVKNEIDPMESFKMESNYFLEATRSGAYTEALPLKLRFYLDTALVKAGHRMSNSGVLGVQQGAF